jgi:hypothetical protein
VVRGFPWREGKSESMSQGRPARGKSFAQTTGTGRLRDSRSRSNSSQIEWTGEREASESAHRERKLWT